MKRVLAACICQKADSSSLIDTGDLNLSDMGTMGNGGGPGGGPGEGFPGGGFPGVISREMTFQNEHKKLHHFRCSFLIRR